MEAGALFWLAVLGYAVTCLAAMGSRSLSEFSPHELKELCRRGRAPNRLGEILRLRDQVALAITALRVLATAVAIGASAFWAWLGWPAGAFDWGLFALTIAGAAAALLAAEVWIPWGAARVWASPLLYHTWPLWKAAWIALAPLVWIARLADVASQRLAGRPPQLPSEESFEEEIRTIVTEGHREGLLEEDAREMIEGVIELGDVDVARIMTPRTDMVSMSKSLSWQEAVELVVKTGHSRIPVYGKNRDDIVGILHIKDLLPLLAKCGAQPEQSWTSLLREPYVVPETKPVDVLLEEFQRTRNHMAVVLDEYGGVSGLVTLEDVLEEIVGEIDDEYDEGMAEGIRDLGNGVYEALGRVHIDELNERLEMTLPEDAEFDTVGGFVFHELGRIPNVGEQLVWNNVRITVLEATRRRIERVRVEALDRQHAEAAG